MKSDPITAKDLIDLLATRHAKDVFVPECKDGPTHARGHRRMDAWVMPRSWSKPDVIAYEVKVSRSDFVNDDKWPDYLGLCNVFYFVTPPKLIDPAELPDGVGLIECTKTRSKLMMKRKAARRDVQIPEEVFRYVLMARAQITPPNKNGRDSREQWTQWLRQREQDRSLGWRVRGKIRELYKENVERVEHENRRLSSRIAGLERAERLLAEMGITDVDSWRIESRVRSAVDEHRTGLSQDAIKALKDAREAIDALTDALSGDISEGAA